MARIITLIRHGESKANANIATANPFDISLTELGRAQAALAAVVLTEAPSLIVSSPMKRAVQTAYPFRKRFPTTSFEQWPVHEFVFLRFDEQGETTPQQRRPLVDAYWKRCDPGELNEGVGVESFRSFMQRVRRFRNKAARHPSESLLVVTHGFFMQAFSYAMKHGFPSIEVTPGTNLGELLKMKLEEQELHPTTPDMMAAIYQQSKLTPFANCQAITFTIT